MHHLNKTAGKKYGTGILHGHEVTASWWQVSYQLIHEAVNCIAEVKWLLFWFGFLCVIMRRYLGIDMKPRPWTGVLPWWIHKPSEQRDYVLPFKHDQIAGPLLMRVCFTITLRADFGIICPFSDRSLIICAIWSATLVLMMFAQIATWIVNANYIFKDYLEFWDIQLLFYFSTKKKKKKLLFYFIFLFFLFPCRHRWTLCLLLLNLALLRTATCHSNGITISMWFWLII